MVVQRRQRQLRYEVHSIGNSKGARHQMIVHGAKRRIAGARARIAVDGGVRKHGVSRDIECQQRHQPASQAMAANGDRGGGGHGLRKSEPRQRADQRRRTRRAARAHRAVHGREAVLGVAGGREKGAPYHREARVLYPFVYAFRAANRDDDIVAAGFLQHESDGNNDGTAARHDFSRQVVGEHRGHNGVAHAARRDGLAGEAAGVLRIKGVGRIDQLREFDG